jgi:hypothetical protein
MPPEQRCNEDQRDEDQRDEDQRNADQRNENRRNDMNSRWKETRTLMVVRSNTARAVEPQYVEDDSEAKPVIVLPVGPSAIAQPAATVGTKSMGRESSPTGKSTGAFDLTDSSKASRIAYFTPGCYAVASLGSLRLTTPALTFDTKHFPRALHNQASIAEARPGNVPEGLPATE